MTNNYKQESIVSVILVILLILLTHPFGWFKQENLSFITMCTIVPVFIVFAALVWKERALDERESFHRMIAGRFAFLVGSGVLVVGIVYQKLYGTLDKWLVFALAAMVLGKIFGRVYSKMKF
jgi:fumarate reductase subunit D